ncbi:MarR family winged helix-turn-helix transcriptional regulator [Compostimonas suwonensis]|uniref:DNA-binding MarR family transcriptional regulator n=1 Tax=Compostimonas suwonensis TaxID=1048394 RepID=A0A2M9BZH2_9MICO|nr:MarR family transcriptional regulator [Compostimonas suwonensis]PJJ63483.1 DNA-binding MarR family transcriptional regulator [Compostimonas suwonensis]
MADVDNSAGPEGRYWYDDDTATGRAVEVLQALRRFHQADTTMRQQLSTDMDMNETDLRALRELIAAEAVGRSVSPKDLTRAIGISSAATAKLLARLVGSGHIRREPSPRDRRAQLLFATPAAHQEVRTTLSAMHTRMLAAAARLDAHEQASVIAFLDDLSEAVSIEREPSPS